MDSEGRDRKVMPIEALPQVELKEVFQDGSLGIFMDSHYIAKPPSSGKPFEMLRCCCCFCALFSGCCGFGSQFAFGQRIH